MDASARLLPNTSAPYKPESFWPLRSGTLQVTLLRTATNDRADTQTANWESLAHELVPLGLATRTIYGKVYQGIGSPGRLIGLAHTVAALAPLYTHNSDGSDIRLLTDVELLSGFFRKDGAELHFPDGRPSIVNIAATHRAIELVAGILASTVHEEE